MQVIINGLITGLTMALLGLAFTLVYLPTRVFHLALGGVYMSVPFVAWACLHEGWPWYFASGAGILAGVVLSLACEVLNHAPLERRNASSGAHLLSSLGIQIVIVQTVVMIWGNQPKVLRMGLDSYVTVVGLVFTRAQLVEAATGLVLLGGFFVWLGFSNLGLQLRGLADNPVEMALRGYNVRRLRLLAFGTSGLLASTAALAVSFDAGFDPHIGLPVLLLAVVAMVIGGRQSFVGPVVGGVLLGFVRSEAVWFLSARWQEPLTFLLLAVFLLLRPEGLLARKGRLEAGA